MKSTSADFCECVKAGATFTPVPQGCRAEKAQLVIKSLGAVSLVVQSEGAAPPGLGRWSTIGLLTTHTRRYKTHRANDTANTMYWTL